jgi:nitrate reductase NapE component
MRSVVPAERHRAGVKRKEKMKRLEWLVTVILAIVIVVLLAIVLVQAGV